MISAKKIQHLFNGPAMFSNETSEYMQNKYNLTPEGKVKELPAEEPLKRQTAPTRSGGGGSSGVLPNDSRSGLDRPHLYKQGGKVKTGWHGFKAGSSGKNKHGF